MLGVEHAAPAFGLAECSELVGGGPEVVKAPGIPMRVLSVMRVSAPTEVLKAVVL